LRRGEIVSGKVSRLADFGAFVEVARVLDGLVHVSEISMSCVSHPSKILHEGEPVEVMVMGIDIRHAAISLSIKEAMITNR